MLCSAVQLEAKNVKRCSITTELFFVLVDKLKILLQLNLPIVFFKFENFYFVAIVADVVVDSVSRGSLERSMLCSRTPFE